LFVPRFAVAILPRNLTDFDFNAMTFARFLAALAASTCALAGSSSVDARTLHVAPQVLAGIPAASQWRTISEAAQNAGPGDEVVLHAGTYRESVVVERSGTKAQPILFRAAPGALVVVTGTDRLENWSKVPDTGGENVFVADWPHRFITWSQAGTHPGDDEHRLIGRAEQVFANGYALRQVLERTQLARGTFFADLEDKKLYVHASNNAGKLDQKQSGTRIEAAVRGNLWESRGDYIRLRGVRFRYAANQAQSGAALFKGRFNTVEDCVFEQANAVGARFEGEDAVVRRCTFQDNGQMGWAASRAHRLLMEGCLTARNNTKNFGRGWEAGGDKIVLCRGVTIRASRFEENRGVGIWFDIGNEDSVVENCLIADNEDAGIFYEISYGLTARDNVIVGNGLAYSSGAWGADGGIALSSSPGCTIERNLLIGNKEGFQFREQGRTTPRLNADGTVKKGDEERVWNHDQIIRSNVFAYNREAQSWGWFDIADERHWPRTLQQNTPETQKAAQDFAAAYNAKDSRGEPKGLSLENLNIRFSNNFYARDAGSGLFHWGTSWKRHKKYANLAEVQKELKLETGSVEGPFAMRDYLTRDFRLPASSPVWKLGAYPRGSVPGVLLGVAK
jgi:nitrous oxidase accessory protein NosD